MKVRRGYTTSACNSALAFKSIVERCDCSSAEELLSTYIDSMTSQEEAVFLESHLVQCAPCKAHLQSLISLRNMLARVERASPPEDSVLDTRVKLSQARNRNAFDWIDSQLNNVL